MAYDVGDNEDDDRIALGSNNPPAGKRGGGVSLEWSIAKIYRPFMQPFIGNTISHVSWWTTHCIRLYIVRQTTDRRPLVCLILRWFLWIIITICRFPIPDVPKGWTPDPRRVWAADTANKENNSPRFAQASAQQDHHAWMKGMTADEVCGKCLSQQIRCMKMTSVLWSVDRCLERRPFQAPHALYSITFRRKTATA